MRVAFRELHALGISTVIENVEEAPLHDPVRLCGSMFGLKVRRHRLFECSFEIEHPRCTAAMHAAQRPIVGVYGRPHGKAGAWPGMLPSTLGTWSAAMGIDWMDVDGLSQAIPPAYTEWIGRRIPGAVSRGPEPPHYLACPACSPPFLCTTCRTRTRSGS